jgi:hypothetical protein
LKSPTPLGALISKIVEPVAASKGIGVATLLTQWPEIVGSRIAKICRPVELKWPAAHSKRLAPHQPAQSTLVLCIDGAFALEAQHSAQGIVDSINAHFGWACVAKVVFRQGPIEEPETKKKARIKPPSASAIEIASAHTCQVERTDLRESLTQLGARVIDKTGDSKRMRS